MRWLIFGRDDLGHISGWNPLVAERHAEATARYLLGACGPAKVVGSRTVERREQRLREMAARQRPKLWRVR